MLAHLPDVTLGDKDIALRYSSGSAGIGRVKIIHRKTGEVIAEGERGWTIAPFEGNYYISGKALKSKGFRVNFLPGLCVYKFLYVWLDFHATDGSVDKNLGWKYWLPNPLFPFIWFRVAVPQIHPDILVVDEQAVDSLQRSHADHG